MPRDSTRATSAVTGRSAAFLGATSTPVSAFANVAALNRATASVYPLKALASAGIYLLFP